MSVEQTITNYLCIAREDLDGAMALAERGNRNAAYLAEQAAEKVIRAVLTSEGVHAGVGHDLRTTVARIPDENPLRPQLQDLVGLAAFATAFRYPTTRRIPPAPPAAEIDAHIAQVGAVLQEVARRFDVDLQNALAPARRPRPIR
jgi:HEPN domain-containing protein